MISEAIPVSPALQVTLQGMRFVEPATIAEAQTTAMALFSFCIRIPPVFCVSAPLIVCIAANAEKTFPIFSYNYTTANSICQLKYSRISKKTVKIQQPAAERSFVMKMIRLSALTLDFSAEIR